MTCPSCGDTRPWDEVWREVVTLEQIPRIGAEDPVPPPPSDAESIIAAYRDYLVSRRRAPGTIALRIRHARQLAAGIPGLATATGEQLDAYVRARADGRSPATVNSEIKSIRALYAWADRFGLIRPNPTTLLDLVPNPHRMGRTVSDADIQRILLGASPRLRALILLGRNGGLRLTEMTTLHTSCRAGGWLTIVAKVASSVACPSIRRWPRR